MSSKWQIWDLNPGLSDWSLLGLGEPRLKCLSGKGLEMQYFIKEASTGASNFPLLLPLPLTQEAPRTQPPRFQQGEASSSPVPSLPGPGPEAAAGRGEPAALFLPEPLSPGARSPTVPWGQIHHATRSGVLSRRVKWPAAAGRWEPITAIFNLIKAVSTIDFGSFNY